MKFSNIFWPPIFLSVILFISCDSALENFDEPTHEGRVYYRLVSVDHDLTEQISEVVSNGRPFQNAALMDNKTTEFTNLSAGRTFISNSIQSSCDCDVIYEDYNGGGLLPWSHQGQVVCFRGNSQINGQLGASNSNTVICVEGTLTIRNNVNLSNGPTFINKGVVEVGGQFALWGFGTFENNGTLDIGSSFSLTGIATNGTNGEIRVGSNMSLHEAGTVFNDFGILEVNPTNTSNANILQLNGGTTFNHFAGAEAIIGGRTNLSDDAVLFIESKLTVYNLQLNRDSRIINNTGLIVLNEAQLNGNSVIENSCVLSIGSELRMNGNAEIVFQDAAVVIAQSLRKNQNSRIRNNTQEFSRVEVVSNQTFSSTAMVEGKIDWIAEEEVPEANSTEEVLHNFDYPIATNTSCQQSFGTFGAQPIILRSLAVVVEQGNTFIHWVVEKEENVDYYRIEASVDARNWKVLKQIPATCPGGCEYFIAL